MVHPLKKTRWIIWCKTSALKPICTSNVWNAFLARMIFLSTHPTKTQSYRQTEKQAQLVGILEAEIDSKKVKIMRTSTSKTGQITTKEKDHKVIAKLHVYLSKKNGKANN